MSKETLRWQVGNIKITSVAELDSATSPQFMFAGVTEKDVLERAEATPWLKPHFVDDDGNLLQKIQCCIIESGDARIAVDTCIGNDKERSFPPWAKLQGSFLDDLAAAGYPCEEITHVICTHLHVDHVGWNTRLVDGEWVPTFPNAEYLFVQAEFDHWRETDDFFGDPVFSDSVQPIADAGLAKMVSPDHVLSDGVCLVSTPGHTPGHTSVVIRSEGQRAIITGDMMHSPLQIADPDLSSMFDTDPDLARETRRAVFPDWADGETLVIGTHFGAPTAGVMKQDGDSYRLETD